MYSVQLLATFADLDLLSWAKLGAIALIFSAQWIRR
jgi:hypothetical protein